MLLSGNQPRNEILERALKFGSVVPSLWINLAAVGAA